MHRITHTQVVPTMFVRMLKLPDEVRADVRRVVAARARSTPPRPARSPVKEQMIDWWGPIVWEYYGGTEGNGLTWCNSQEWLAHKGTVGRAVVGALHICDDDGNELPPGETGTVYFADGTAVRVPQRSGEDRRRPATPRAGPRSATSATSMPTATCT